jgi:hypothetical protein
MTVPWTFYSMDRSATGDSAQGGGRDQPRDRGGLADRAFVRLQVDEARA